MFIFQDYKRRIFPVLSCVTAFNMTNFNAKEEQELQEAWLIKQRWEL